MKTLKMFGYSDDLVECEGIPGCDEFDVWHNGDSRGKFVVSDGQQAICIHALYCGSWAFAITSENDRDDYRTMPDWPVRRSFGKDCDYSETIEIDVPDNAVLRRVEK